MPDRQPKARRFGGRLAFVVPTAHSLGRWSAKSDQHCGGRAPGGVGRQHGRGLDRRISEEAPAGRPRRRRLGEQGVLRRSTSEGSLRRHEGSTCRSPRRAIARSQRRSTDRSTTSHSAPAHRRWRQIASRTLLATSSVPFFTPLVVATFTNIAQVLERAGVAHDHGGWWTLDMKGFLDLAARHVRWNELPGNTAYPSTNLVGITSTDVTTSNSAEMYASIASYVSNQDRVLGSPRERRRGGEPGESAVPRAEHMATSRRRHCSATTSPREKAPTPMAMISEAPFVARAAAHDGSHSPEHGVDVPGSRCAVEDHARSAHPRRRHRRAAAHRRSEPPAARDPTRLPHDGEPQPPSAPSCSSTTRGAAPGAVTRSSHPPATSSRR